MRVPRRGGSDGPVRVCLSELLEALRTGDAVDLIRESVRMVMQELIDAEATAAIGAACYQRTETRIAASGSAAPHHRPCSTSPALLNIYSRVAPTLHDEAAETDGGMRPPGSSDRQALEAVDER